MDPTDAEEVELDRLRGEVKSKRDLLQQKFEQLEHKVLDKAKGAVEFGEETFESVSHAFDLGYQVRQRPWVAVGVATVAGFVAGRVLLPIVSGGPNGAGYKEPPSPPEQHDEPRADEEQPGDQASDHKEEGTPLLSQMGSLFGGLRQAATVATTGVLTQVARSLFEQPANNQGGIARSA